MRVEDIRMLFDYGYQTNARLLDTAALLTPDQFTQPVFKIGSIHRTLVHQMSAEWVWRSRLQDGISPRSTRQTRLPVFKFHAARNDCVCPSACTKTKS